MLKIKNVEKYYGNKNTVTKALDGLSFSVSKGEFLGVMGASGSGKTTLLNCISTIDKVSAGNIYLGGENISELPEERLATFRREQLGFVFQDFNLLDTLTIEENIAITLLINKLKPKEITSTVWSVAEKLNITEILHKFPYEVSGGQKQRAAIARAIVNKQRLILADEPTGALDSKASKTLLDIMGLMNRDLKSTILMVTHDAYSACHANRVLFLKDGRLFNEIYKGNKTKREFFSEILDVLALLGGDMSDVW